MHIKKVNSDAIKLYETSQVKLKTAGNTREVQFTAGNNTFCPIQNISKNKYLDKETGEIWNRQTMFTTNTGALSGRGGTKHRFICHFEGEREIERSS